MKRGVVAGVAEDDGGVGLLALDEVEQVARLGVRVDRVVDDVLDPLDGEDVARQQDGLRIVQVALDDLLDVLRDGGREEQRLAFVGERVEDAGDLLEETHREHLVGLIQHRDLSVVELERATANVIVDPTGRAHDDLAALPEGLDLLGNRSPAVDRHHLRAFVLAETLDLFRHLNRQLAGGAEDDGPHLVGPGGDALENGNAEGGGLSGSGLGANDEVLALENRLEHDRLNRGWNQIALLGDGPLDLRRDGQLLEGLLAAVIARDDLLVRGALDGALAGRGLIHRFLRVGCPALQC